MKKSFFLIAIIAIFGLIGCQTKPTKTIENLKAAIKGETTASAKYKAFAEKARTEGLDTVAKLFDAASQAEGIHAANHTRYWKDWAKKWKSLILNLT